MLSTLKNEEVSQNILVFKLADTQIERERDNYNCNYKYHYTTLLLRLQVQKYYATLHNNATQITQQLHWGFKQL